MKCLEHEMSIKKSSDTTPFLLILHRLKEKKVKGAI